MTTPVLFLDNASRHVGIAARDVAEQLATTLLSTLKGLRKINKRFALNTAVPIAQYQIADNWTLQAILGGNASKEEWEFIRHLSDRSPFAAEMEEGLLQEIKDIEFCTRAGKIPSAALAWAALLDSATVSFNAHPDWSGPWVETEYLALGDDDQLYESEKRVRNTSKVEHVDVHLDWLRLLGLSEDPSARQIWTERIDRYPGLRFLPRVENDLLALEGSGAPFRQALSALHALAEDVANWQQNQPWPEFSTKASPESETRRKLCWTEDEVSNAKECFDWHTRFTGGLAGRIHFRVDEVARNIVVAYIGGKLEKGIPS